MAQPSLEKFIIIIIIIIIISLFGLCTYD